MKSEAEQRPPPHEVFSGGGGGIPEDVVALILSRLPLKSIGRFKSVSKSWHQLIQTLNLPPFFHSLFFSILYRMIRTRYTNPPAPPFSCRQRIFQYIVGGAGGGIDNNSPFLSHSDNRVLDCCNGLLLLCQPHHPNYSYYICNPLTKSWTQLYDLDPNVSCLDFDPNVSPHFKIITFPAVESVLSIRVLSSETPTMTWKSYEPVGFRDPSDEYHFMMPRHQHHALWEGSLYLLFGSSNGVDFGDAGRIMRFDLLEDHVADRQLIELPIGTEKPKCVGIGRSRNKLCLAGLDWIYNNNYDLHRQMVPRLRVWSLSKRDQTVWVMEHDSIITSSHILSAPPANGLDEPTYIGHFHPFLNIVFIISKNTVYTYDLKNLSLNEVCRIGSNKWEIIEASIFPFIPSMVDYSTQW